MRHVHCILKISTNPCVWLVLTRCPKGINDLKMLWNLRYSHEPLVMKLLWGWLNCIILKVNLWNFFLNIIISIFWLSPVYSIAQKPLSIRNCVLHALWLIRKFPSVSKGIWLTWSRLNAVLQTASKATLRLHLPRGIFKYFKIGVKQIINT